MAKWKKFGQKLIATKPDLPGVRLCEQGGWHVRARAKNPKTGKSEEVEKVLQIETAEEALQWLRNWQKVIRAGGPSAPRVRKRFSEFATSLYERKIETDELSSQASIQKWDNVLTRHLVPELGDMWFDMITRADLESWRLDCARKVKQGKMAPTTVNTHLAILRVIMKAATAELDLPRNPCDGLSPLPLRNHRTYTAEEPNSLPPEQVPKFLRAMKAKFPQHYAMTLLGFTTGLRPSQMRPLRRDGRWPDVLWKDRYLLVRRSQTISPVTMNSTKIGVDQRLAVPDELLETFLWHIKLLKKKQATSDLLFPSVRGGFRARSCLDVPFKSVAKEIGVRHKITPRGMRRTYQDLSRAANIADLVTRSISGHHTEQMQEHYSTVSDDEQRSAMAKVISLAEARQEKNTGS